MSLKTTKPKEMLGTEREEPRESSAGTRWGKSLLPTSSSSTPFRRTEVEMRSPASGLSQNTSLVLEASSSLRSSAVAVMKFVFSSNRTRLPDGYLEQEIYTIQAHGYKIPGT